MFAALGQIDLGHYLSRISGASRKGGITHATAELSGCIAVRACDACGDSVRGQPRFAHFATGDHARRAFGNRKILSWRSRGLKPDWANLVVTK